MSRVPPARSTRVGAFDLMRMVVLSRGVAEGSRGILLRAAGNHPVAGHDLRAVFPPGLCRIGFEAAAAARFVRIAGADDDQVFVFDQPLRVHGGIAAAYAD